jgi:hypothetical protein
MSQDLIYANAKQQIFLYQTHPVKFFHGGRGTGKSHSIAWAVLEKVNQLPRSTGMLTCKTLTQVQNKTLPVIKSVWKSMGMVEGEHYVCFKRRPDHFLEPFKEPEEFKNVVWFCNGTCFEIVASTQYDSARGGSYDWIEGDEIGFFPEAFYDDVILPSNRGNTDKFFTTLLEFGQSTGREIKYLRSIHNKYRPTRLIPHPLHHQVSLYTSPPRKTENMWIYKFKKLAEENPSDFFWLEASALDNIEAFGRKNFDMIKKQMNKRSFQAEMLGKRIMEAEKLFYFGYQDNTHSFNPNTGYKNVNGTIFRDISIPTINSHKALHLSFDFSGWFNCMLISQHSQSNGFTDEYFHDSMYLSEGSVDQLIDNFCHKYRFHEYKYAMVYGEPRGHDKTPQGTTLYEAIKKKFLQHGWKCEILTPKNKRTEAHSERYRIVNEIFMETNNILPRIRFNRITCANPIQAIKFTEVNHEFQKIKYNERKREFPQEHAPHFTDAMDYLIFQKYGARISTVKSSLEYKII